MQLWSALAESGLPDPGSAGWLREHAQSPKGQVTGQVTGQDGGRLWESLGRLVQSGFYVYLFVFVFRLVPRHTADEGASSVGR